MIDAAQAHSRRVGWLGRVFFSGAMRKAPMTRCTDLQRAVEYAFLRLGLLKDQRKRDRTQYKPRSCIVLRFRWRIEV